MPRDGVTIFSDLIGKLDVAWLVKNAGVTVVMASPVSSISVAEMPS